MIQADVVRPRVLLADDDAGILKAISRTLATEFEVVATVTDGRKALDAVPRLDPDVVVLDISMPGLNGFQTAEELKRLGSRAKIVFLTMHQGDHFVSKAIRCGAMGYVLKTLASSDLTPALQHALAGRRYLPSLTPLVMTGADTHAVQFCGDDSSGLDEVAAVLSSAFHRGDIVATALIESNRDALAVRMEERGWNLADVGRQGRYLVFDAEEAATRIMRAGRPHRDTIAEMVAALESARRASAAGPRSHLTIVGEMSAVLCRRGSPEAALELERFWDELTRSLPILTICTYPTGCFDHDGVPGFVSSISAHHSVISHALRA
jgi:DNA-binding NarL/FixJ family response regulator